MCSDLDENDRAGPAAKKIKRNTGSDDDEEEYEEEDGGDHRTWDKRRSHLQSPSQLSFSDTALANLTERFENGDRNLEPYLRRVRQPLVVFRITSCDVASLFHRRYSFHIFIVGIRIWLGVVWLICQGSLWKFFLSLDFCLLQL